MSEKIHACIMYVRHGNRPHMVGHANARLHLWKPTTWNFICKRLSEWLADSKWQRQIYNIVIWYFYRLYSIESCYKIFIIVPVLYITFWYFNSFVPSNFGLLVSFLAPPPPHPSPHRSPLGCSQVGVWKSRCTQDPGLSAHAHLHSSPLQPVSPFVPSLKLCPPGSLMA